MATKRTGLEPIKRVLARTPSVGRARYDPRGPVFTMNRAAGGKRTPLYSFLHSTEVVRRENPDIDLRMLLQGENNRGKLRRTLKPNYVV